MAETVRGLLYFVPGVNGITSEDVTRLGLGAIFGVGVGRTCTASAGPGGQTGCLVTRSVKAKEMQAGYYPDRQNWSENTAQGYWVGVDRAHAPVPEDLLLDAGTNGYRITLADGNEWIVPIARIPDFGVETTLIQLVGCDGAGRRCLKPLPEHGRINALACALAPWYLGEMVDDYDYTGPEVDREVVFNLACLALQAHYALNQWGISVLGILTTNYEQTIVGLVCDMPKVIEACKAKMEAAKKNSPASKPDTSCGEPGATGACPNTVPAQGI